MRILHTSDWHVGRTIRGRSRDDEHRAMVAELAALAREREVDLVLVAGDIFDTAAPSPASEELVYRGLLDLAATGAQVVLIAGNHDNPRRIRAVQPLLELANVHCSTEARPPDDGGVLDLHTRSGETARIALLPWLSQRRIVTAAELMKSGADVNIGLYAVYFRGIVEELTCGFGASTVNIVMAHVATDGSVFGGGEREAQSVHDYCVPAQAFPPSAHYVALGHIHRPQHIAAAAPVWYSGSPLELDFGEGDYRKQTLIVEASPGTPATVDKAPVTAGRELRTLRGTLAEVMPFAKAAGDAYLRLILDEPARAGLSDEVRAELPNAVDIRLVPPERDPKKSGDENTTGLSPTELFGRFLAERGAGDQRVEHLFRELWEEAIAAGPA